MSDENRLTLEAKWDCIVVTADRSSTRNLLLHVSADGEGRRRRARQPINLSMVIDRSGSMAHGRLTAAKHAAQGIVEALRPDDMLSVVAYDDEVMPVSTNVRMDAQGRCDSIAAIARLSTGGMTDLGSGWFEGARCAAFGQERAGYRDGHVLLLSDGRANRGITDPEVLAEHAKELAARGIRTSSVGIGADYSPLQLDALAEAGQGRLHDAETPEDIVDIVLGELGELRSVAAKDLRLRIRMPQDVTAELLTRTPVEQAGHTLDLSLGDLLIGRSRPVALALKLPAKRAGARFEFELTLSWIDPETGDERSRPPVNTSLSVVLAVVADQAERDCEVVRQVSDLWEATLAYRAMRLNERHDFAAATQLYSDNLTRMDAFVADLDDAPVRRRRYAAAQSAVGRRWEGRSKREALVSAKKAMRNEADLRRRNTGQWHDHLGE